MPAAVPILVLVAGVLLMRYRGVRRIIPLLSMLSLLGVLRSPSRRAREAKLDEALDESFPASDPPALR